MRNEDDLYPPTIVDPAHDSGPAVAALPAVEVVGRYEILGLLSTGGMGQVFLARDGVGDARLQHLVLKYLAPHLTQEPDAVRAFLDEAQIANRLYHPNICHVYEAGQLEDTYYMAMEWVHGTTLSNFIRHARAAGGVPPEVAVRIISQVARALDYAHGAKGEGGRLLDIVHRDVSPQNVMVSWTGAVKLLDFGIAKAATLTARTQAGAVKGKYGYMAPEQWDQGPLDRRTDVFALGICLYEVLTGQRLYGRETMMAAMRAIVEEPVPSLRAVSPALPQELDAITQKALQKDPAHRFQSAAELHDALERYLTITGQVVTAARIAEVLDASFDEEDKAPLPARGRSTTPVGRGTPGGRRTPVTVQTDRLGTERSPWVLFAFGFALAVAVTTAVGLLL